MGMCIHGVVILIPSGLPPLNPAGWDFFIYGNDCNACVYNVIWINTYTYDIG